MEINSISPFDWDLLGMVKSLTKNEVYLDSNPKRRYLSFTWTLDFANYETTKELKQTKEAIINAIKGRMGDRYIDTYIDDVNNFRTMLKFEGVDYPDQYRFELKTPREEMGKVYIPIVPEFSAIQFKKDNYLDVSEFVGGGFFTFPSKLNPKEKSVLEFPNENGILLVVKETEFITFKNGRFSIVPEKEFNNNFKLK